MHHDLGRLTTLEAKGHLSMRLLTLMTSPGRLSLAGTGTAAAADAVVVGSLCVGEGGEDGSRALLLVQEGVQEGRDGLVGLLREHPRCLG